MIHSSRFIHSLSPLIVISIITICTPFDLGVFQSQVWTPWRILPWCSWVMPPLLRPSPHGHHPSALCHGDATVGSPGKAARIARAPRWWTSFDREDVLSSLLCSRCLAEISALRDWFRTSGCDRMWYTWIFERTQIIVRLQDFCP